MFQPAEEGLGGMQAMIDDGLMSGPDIDIGLGFHNDPDMPVGQFGFVRGPALAAMLHRLKVVSSDSNNRSTRKQSRRRFLA